MRSVICITTDEQFDSIKSAALHFGLAAAGICQTCRKIIPQTGGLKFRYLDEPAPPEPIITPKKELKVILVKKSHDQPE